MHYASFYVIQNILKHFPVSKNSWSASASLTDSGYIVTHLSEADVSVDAIKKVATQLTMRL